jgi:hypothetical protein
MHQVGDIFELNVKLRCQKVKSYLEGQMRHTGEKERDEEGIKEDEKKSLKCNGHMLLLK